VRRKKEKNKTKQNKMKSWFQSLLFLAITTIAITNIAITGTDANDFSPISCSTCWCKSHTTSLAYCLTTFQCLYYGASDAYCANSMVPSVPVMTPVVAMPLQVIKRLDFSFLTSSTICTSQQMCWCSSPTFPHLTGFCLPTLSACKFAASTVIDVQCLGSESVIAPKTTTTITTAATTTTITTAATTTTNNNYTAVMTTAPTRFKTCNNAFLCDCHYKNGNNEQKRHCYYPFYCSSIQGKCY
jgi:hypothetical protein